MIRLPPATAHTAPLFPYATLFRSFSFMIVPPDPAPQFDAASVSEKSSLRVLLQPRLLVLFALIFLGNGYFNAIFTWLEPMLGANGIDAEHAGDRKSTRLNSSH